MIHRWENDRSGISERCRLHYCKAFQIPTGQFGHQDVLTARTTRVARPGARASEVMNQADPYLAASQPGRDCTGCNETALLSSVHSIADQLLAAAYESGDYARAAAGR
jgi:hypothetical protein